MKGLLQKSQLFIKRNSSTILTVMGGVGVVATTVLAVKATPKALERIEEATQEKGEELTIFETVTVSFKPYVPTLLTGAATVACIFGANALNKQQQASLMSAYALVDTSFKEYKAKLKEIHGEEAHNDIINSIMIEKAEDINVTAANFCTTCDLSVEENDGEPKLFYDEHSGRYFETTIEQVMNAEYHLNRNYILRGYAYLNEFYEFLGLSETDYGSVLGWTPTDEGEYWIDFNHRKTILDDGLEVYIIDMLFEPRYDFLEY